jgi:hypothetical protein
VKEDHRLREFGYGVLWKAFEHKQEELTKGWKELHNEEIHNLFSSPSITTLIKPKRIRGDEGCSA